MATQHIAPAASRQQRTRARLVLRRTATRRPSMRWRGLEAQASRDIGGGRVRSFGGMQATIMHLHRTAQGA